MKVYLIYDSLNQAFKGIHQWSFTKNVEHAKAYKSLSKAKQAVSYTNWKGRRELNIQEYSMIPTGLIYVKYEGTWNKMAKEPHNEI